MSEDQTKIFYVLSDAVGTIAKDALNNAFVQFPNIEYKVRIFPFVHYTDYLKRILKSAKDCQASIISTFIKEELEEVAKDYCEANDLFYYNLIDPLVQHIAKEADKAPRQKPGNKKALDKDYYRRIEAIEFAVKNDDGKHPADFKKADIVLLGISRTSKTPLSLFLANQGYKVTNLPLVPEAHLPEELYEVDPEKIIGLTNDVNVLNKFRRERLRSYGIQELGRYSDDQRIQKELDYADQIYAELGCPVINVADRSIEETATLILMFLNFQEKEAEE